MLVPLYIFAFKGADAQIAALASARGTVMYLVAIALACVVVAAFSVRESKRRGLSFEDDDADAFTTLSLSEAL